MAEHTITRTKRDGLLTFKDGTRTYNVAYEKGDLKLNIPGPTVIHSLDRGRITSPPDLRLGDDQPMSGAFTCRLRSSSQAAATTIADFITRSGYVASTWVSTLASGAEVFTTTLAWFIEGSDHGGVDETITCPYCWVKGGYDESGDVAILNIEFDSYAVYPTIS